MKNFKKIQILLVFLLILNVSPVFSVDTLTLGDGADLKGILPFPSNNVWNQDISEIPVDPNSAKILANCGPSAGIHADFGSGKYNNARIGIPYIVVPSDQPLVDVMMTAYANEADPGPYPIPPNAPIEGYQTTDSYSDNHLIVVQLDPSKPNGMGSLFEMFRANPIGNYPASVDHWEGYGCKFDLNSNRFRPHGITSTDAAGLPIFPGLVRYDEVKRAVQDFKNGGEGVVHHAFRFTLAPGYTRRGYVYPAVHWASYSDNPDLAPMGMRVRLRSSYAIPSNWPDETKAILRTLKKYGMILADNGGNWFLCGSPNESWNNDFLRYLGYTHGSDFEVVKMGEIITPSNPGDTQPPSKPGNLSTSLPSATSIKLNWTASTDNRGVAFYNIYNNQAFVGKTSNLNYTLSGLAPDQTYQLEVSATDAWGNESAQNSISVKTADLPPDQIPPTVSITQPLPGSSWEGTVTVKAIASDNLGISRVEFNLDGQLASTSNQSPFEWKWDTSLTANGAHNLSVKAYDLTGNMGASSDISITIFNLAPLSLWDASTLPASLSEADSGSVELGVKFQSDVAGTVTDIRFYKGAGNNGLHVGTLWDSSGVKLASVTFSNETATGWQQANFSIPVAITTGKTYVASYFAPLGHYSANASYFSAGYSHPPLHAPVNAGVYTYATASAFPNQTYQACNYWVDLTFVPTTTTKQDQTISFASLAQKTYGDADFVLTATSSSGLPVNYASSDSSVAAIQGSTLTIKGAGTTVITASQSGNNSYNPAANVQQSLTVNKTGLIARANDQARPYGQPNPILNAAFAGFVNGDTIASIQLNPTLSCSANSSSVVGTYPIVISGPSSTQNYAVTYQSGMLTVYQAGQTIQFGALPDKVYGDGAFNPIAFASSGLPVAFSGNNPGVAIADGSTVGIVGTGTVTITARQAGDTNFKPAPDVSQTFKVSKAGLTVMANNKTRDVGQAPPLFDASFVGLINGDNISSLSLKYSLSCAATESSPAGTYPIVASGDSSTSNYDVTYQNGILTITDKPSAEPPTFTPEPGTYSSGQTVTLQSSTPGAAIRYTTDGSFPNSTNGTLYTGPVQISQTTVIRAMVLVKGLKSSPAATGVYAVESRISPLSVWTGATVLDYSAASDPNGVELGMKFSSKVNGVITGLKFYKGVGNASVHTGNLWATSGKRLATVKFSGETSTGWQQMEFASPVVIQKETTYIVSYFAPKGHYAYNIQYFTRTSDHGPLVTPANAGVFRYGTSSGFPSYTWQAANYWVDVLFVPDEVFQNQDIGTVGVSGKSTYNSATDTFTLQTSGSQIWGTADQFQFMYRDMTGDGEITARVAGFQDTRNRAKAGVMIRENLTPGSRYAMTALTPAYGVFFQQRYTPDGTSVTTTDSEPTAPSWVKLLRRGNLFIGLDSTDGIHWNFIRSITVDMGSTVKAGLCLSNYSNAALGTATFDHIEIR